MIINKYEARQYANIVMDLFGFDDRIIDNVLEHEERQLFYLLESEGILNTERDEITLYDGRIWRIHYWLLRKNKIYQYSQCEIGDIDRVKMEKVHGLPHKTIYSSLPKYMWTARRL